MEFWPRETGPDQPLLLTQAQFDALVVGLPWQRLPEMSVITRLWAAVTSEHRGAR